MFYIRADANNKIATGHVMRCMAIAKQIEALGEPCTFLSADDNAKEMIEENGFNFLCLNTNWEDLDQETEVLVSLIQERKIKVLLVDSYFVTQNYLDKLSNSTKVVYMDDIHRFPYPVHTVIHYGIFDKEYTYDKSNTNDKQQYLLGCDYIPLREEFKQKTAPNRENISDILITTGGTDPFNLAGNLIKRLKDSGLHLHVVSGKLNTHYKELVDLSTQNDYVSVYTNIKNMSELMINCDVAISAAGTTLYELCACGVPTISVSFADNQISGAKELDRRDIIKYAGDLRTGLEGCLDKIETILQTWEKNKKLRKEKRDKMQALVDGNGAMRIAAYCLNLQKEE